MNNTSEDVRQFFWRNYLAHSIEGGLFVGGMAFLAETSVLPAMVKSLGGPTWLISLMPMMMMLGFLWPPLLTAHRVEQLYRVKPLVLLTGIFQRIPFLFAAIALFTWSDTHPRIVLALVALAPFISGATGGISLSAWMELTSRILPEHRRASAWAIRFVIGSCIGVCAGPIIKSVLEDHPGVKGYGILHLFLFGFLLLSYMIFTMIRETSIPESLVEPTRGLTDNLRDVPRLLWDDKRLRTFVYARMFTMGIFIMTPFLAIHTLEVTGKTESYLGFLVAAQMTGGILGNIVAGYLGDRRGTRLLLIIARVVFVAVCFGAAFNTTEIGFLAIFLFFGFAFGLDKVGSPTLSIEIAPLGRRPTYFAILSTSSLPCMLVAAGISTLVEELTGKFAVAAIISAAAVASSLIFICRIQDPRNANPQG